MAWSPLFSGQTGSGRALFKCPTCGCDSIAGKFDIDQKAKRMQCKACLRIADLDLFKTPEPTPSAPAGMISDGAVFVTAILAILGFALFVCFTPPSPSFPDASRARAAAAEWARLSHERGITCRQQMSALGRALGPDDYSIPKESEAFYEGCMGVYSEE